MQLDPPSREGLLLPAATRLYNRTLTSWKGFFGCFFLIAHMFCNLRFDVEFGEFRADRDAND